MAIATTTIGSRVGLHARPAALFARAAADLPVDVTIALGDGEPVDASSMLSVMTLGAAFGDSVTLRADGDGADAAVGSLAELLASELDEA
ncbi:MULTISPECIES: HPr family phosphocarrier protein [Rhodococcus]|jgi:phosphocarrier protein HPr|uniref:Phosphocarrier protein HPr n=3 Tax=Rhodococcus erythropolis group TaxID=2840174 RepID=A0A069JCY1_RHOSG|nr:MULTISPECIES: HPr family phosphocarrier protein [Rhodococcus]EEN88847.1 phosphocarrier, HPr family [Rhodococcus erythropolis SK121]NHE68469.1 HPr family phosphocarrier protein [Rhodococcus sp. D-46]ANQ74618.1 phosphotransferase [Rhodococcus sp. 008]AUS33090.1 HPr family phosphocarrier protein [Rhodococcus qingshengii]AZI63124.1 HPr family phosphocarrier protein [Rhodococcus sp. NJ-530]